jgi:hypothetical protein
MGLVDCPMKRKSPIKGLIRVIGGFSFDYQIMLLSVVVYVYMAQIGGVAVNLCPGPSIPIASLAG